MLLGDVLELRHGPLREAMAAARAVLRGPRPRARPAASSCCMAGNHDHALVEPWLARRGAESEPPPLGLEQLLEPERGLAGVCAASPRGPRPARVRVAYPGLWVREDVYATHGHYLDCHLTIPTLERLSVGVMSRVLGRSAQQFDCVDDYEAVGAPVFAWRDAVARDAHTGSILNGLATVGAWRALGGPPEAAPPEAATPAANRGRRRPGKRLADGWGSRARGSSAPCGAGRSWPASRSPSRCSTAPASGRCAPRSPRASCAARACARWTRSREARPRRRLRRVRPHAPRRAAPGRRPAASGAGAAARGSSTPAAGPTRRSSSADAPSESPYWPGACVLVEDAGEPRVIRLLRDHSSEQLRPPRAAAAQR